MCEIIQAIVLLPSLCGEVSFSDIVDEGRKNCATRVPFMHCRVVGVVGVKRQAVNLMMRHLTKVSQLIMVSRQFLGLVYSLYTDSLAAMLRYLNKVSEIYSTTLSKIIAPGS